MKSVKKIIKISISLSILYLFITTLIMGYEDTNEKKGIYNFYWSGINAFWKPNKDFGLKINKTIRTHFNGLDGPYVVENKVYSINGNNILDKTILDSSKTVKVNTNSTKLKSFKVKLKDQYLPENQIYNAPDKLIAISDVEGNFNGLLSFLIANNVIDEHANWIFNDGHLVLNGDFFDRGNQVTQVLWLIYHLENQAEKNGGKVHFILGNHEIMNLYGNVKYNDPKYIHVAKQISNLTPWDKAVSYLYSEHTELGKWLRTKNIIEKIGDIIFVHGGLNKFHYKGAYSINELNNIAKDYYGIVPNIENLKNERDRIVISGINSPFWDRRLNLDFKHKMALKTDGIDIEPTTQEELDSILSYYKASKIVIGHSIVDDISTDYNNKVVKIDVKHGETFNSGKTKGILIENSQIHKIDDTKGKVKLDI
ncbi:metallophosphoesterase [Flaviramulus sp. BrNp1-15]|uniref:metallophosphoesterase n=1 Tax=Flaviramulus sp. BrNp1-15 TaxID=2916754 RepID=UPI001EE7EA0B|nr:metallophosphoesterase [Flaviramulus sp. BrNp1-15]ULC58177.1 metallophosphoesterase [Flaviramulus sp. BrNp1-15]